MDRFNPFTGLGFSEEDENTRPSFETKWIINQILMPGALASLNGEARGILLAIVETGARASEICNLPPEAIVLDHDVPHIAIRPRREREDPRQIKTSTSIREVPLVGVSLAAFKANPLGFPRYRERGTQLSAVLMKHFRKWKLLPTPAHSIYSLRHAFEDRMKEAHIDDELRRILMGHALERPRYGSGGSLRWRQENLLRMVLPFEMEIL
jgi:integrase